MTLASVELQRTTSSQSTRKRNWMTWLTWCRWSTTLRVWTEWWIFRWTKERHLKRVNWLRCRIFMTRSAHSSHKTMNRRSTWALFLREIHRACEMGTRRMQVSWETERRAPSIFHQRTSQESQRHLRTVASQFRPRKATNTCISRMNNLSIHWALETPRWKNWFRHRLLARGRRSATR